jgi:RNA polymerase sigma factor (TIGR02999 family)
MSEVTQLLAAIGAGDEQATRRLLPLVYDELRRLARVHMARERLDHTLGPTALVHEAYLRLIGEAANSPSWTGRGHFFYAAAEAMRRILIEHARSKGALKRGGARQRSDLDADQIVSSSRDFEFADLLALDDALQQLEAESPAKAKLVKLRYFAGLTLNEAAEAMDISETTAKRYWVTAKAWLFDALDPSD